MQHCLVGAQYISFVFERLVRVSGSERGGIGSAQLRKKTFLNSPRCSPLEIEYNKRLRPWGNRGTRARGTHPPRHRDTAAQFQINVGSILENPIQKITPH